MPFPFSAEGRIEVPIGSSESAQYVGAGIEQWLIQQRARNLRWDGSQLRFAGPDRSPFRRQFRNALRGVGDSEIRFQHHREKVIVEYKIDLGPTDLLFTFAFVSLPLILISVGDPRFLLLLPLVLGGLFIMEYLGWLAARHEFDWNFRIAGIRGLADGAERELGALQTR
jgi:hypothetical protein